MARGIKTVGVLVSEILKAKTSCWVGTNEKGWVKKVNPGSENLYKNNKWERLDLLPPYIPRGITGPEE